jgi:tRNA-specific 2-thiouridylase
MCNSKLKFDHLIERARALDAEWVATGHYARVTHHGDGRPSELRTGVDPAKDQSYFLFDMPPENLRRALFPLGELTKKEVRAIAARLGMHVAEKRESQEICFVAGRRYTDFLADHYPEVTAGRAGELVDRSGKVLGRHDGIHLFTVGQRKGLGGLGEPKYVAAIDAATNRVIVGDLDELAVPAFAVEGVNWLVTTDLSEERALSVMVRYRAKTVPCRVVKDTTSTTDGRWQVLLAEPARWVTPGQAAVFYDQERVIGGGFIATPPTFEWAPRATERSVQAPGRLQPAMGQPSEDLHAP